MKKTIVILMILALIAVILPINLLKGHEVYAREYLAGSLYDGASPDNPIEIIEERTESSKKFSIGGNSYAIEATIGAIHYKNDKQDENEQWKDIDTTISPEGLVSLAPYDLQVYLTGQPGFHYVSKESGEFDVRIVVARQDSASLIPVPHDSKVVPIIEGNTVTWHDLYPDVDVVLTAFNTGVSLNRIIKSASAPLEYDIQITEVEKGVAQLKPIKPAEDANGQFILMEEKPVSGGRTETLKLEVVSENPQPIVYPIRDSTIIDDQPTAANDDDGWQNENSGNTISANDYVVARDDAAAANREWAFMRWVIAIDSGSTIDIAYIKAYSAYSFYDDVSADIHFELGASPTQLTSGSGNFNVQTRDMTDAVSTWTQTGFGTGWQQSPSLVDPLQEVIDDYTTTAIAAIWEPPIAHNYRVYWRGYDYSDHSLAPTIYIEYTEGGGEPSIANTPASENLGLVSESSTYYAYGSAPSNPVQDGECTFTITNDGSVAIDITIECTNFTGGNGWTLTSSSPGSAEVRLTAYYSGQNPASGIVLTTSPQSFYSNLASSATLKWDFKFETGTFTDGVEKTSTITLTASAA